jgi:hypothetical protein
MEHHTKLLQFRAPESLSEAIDAAAKRELQTKSEYVSRSVIDRLRASGVDPSCLAADNVSFKSGDKITTKKAAIAALTSTGILVRTADDTWALRALTGTANEITVTKG